MGGWLGRLRRWFGWVAVGLGRSGWEGGLGKGWWLLVFDEEVGGADGGFTAGAGT